MGSENKQVSTGAGCLIILTATVAIVLVLSLGGQSQAPLPSGQGPAEAQAAPPAAPERLPAKTKLSVDAGRLQTGKTTRPAVVATLGKPTWVWLPGDKDAFTGEPIDFSPDTVVELGWDNGVECPPVMATFDRRGILLGLDEGRACFGDVAKVLREGLYAVGPTITCSAKDRRRYCEVGKG